jgi:hypothetical protein
MVKLSFFSLVFFIYYGTFAQAPANGLILHYTFEDMVSTIVPDASNNNNNGNLVGGAIAVAGHSGNGVQCIVKADYIELPDNINTTLTSFTYATWVKLNSLKNATRFFDWGNGASATNNFLCFIPSYGGDNAYMTLRYRTSSGTGFNITSTSKCPTGSWAHVAVTYDWNSTTSSGTGTIYLNGNAVGSGTITSTAINLNPAEFIGNSVDNYLGYSRWPTDGNGFDGIFDDVRIYNRALTAKEIMLTAGYPSELITQWETLDLGIISALENDITLPGGTGGVTITWVSSNPLVISNTGTVTRPSQYDATVKLTATLKLGADSLQKEFTATVKAFNATEGLLAKWDFASNKITFQDGVMKVEESSDSKFVGTLKNVAKIRTIGNASTSKFNVLDLGDNKGYMDLDTMIGKAIYSLQNYHIGAYFYIDPSYTLGGTAGNCLWTFSNADYQMATGNGAMLMSLNRQGNYITPSGWDAQTGATLNTNATTGVWTHIAYTQDGDSGRLFINGVQVQSAKVSLKPATALVIAGRTGTNYNTIGKPAYNTTDAYLSKTLVYGLELYNEPITSGDLLETLEVDTMLAALSAAFAANPGTDTLAELKTELANLTLPDLSAVTGNITLPTQGTTYPSVLISWRSNFPQIISSTGVVTRPDYYDGKVKLTAILFLNGQTVTKDFDATVIKNPASAFASDLLLHYNFEDSLLIGGPNIKDAAEKHFIGTFKNNASIKVLGSSTKYNVLSLDSATSYFDMGAECGKLVYGLKDYSISMYFRLDTAKKNLSNAGNFLYAFSNSTKSETDRNGYMFGRASVTIHCVASEYWGSGNMATPDGTAPSLGNFHHFVYTQNDTIGTAYIDGVIVGAPVTFKKWPSELRKDGLMGTNYNFLGRANFTTDAYLAKAMLHDFRLYKKALDATEVLNMSAKSNLLDVAYEENVSAPVDFPVGVNKKEVNGIRISTFWPGTIRIIDATGDEQFQVYNLHGRMVYNGKNTNITVQRPGIYIVKVCYSNGKFQVTKVWVP